MCSERYDDGSSDFGDEPLLSFGDDTVAAINQLEISRFISQQKHFGKECIATNLTYSISQHYSNRPVCSPLFIRNSIKNKSYEESFLCHSASNKPLNTQDKTDLAKWCLPTSVLEQYHRKGIKNMFHWQVECLSDSDVLGGKNLVYSAPTSAGKTLVAEILTLKTVLEKKKKALIIVPFVSVVREKMFYFQDLLESSGINVQGLMGSHTLQGGFKNVDVAICTIEKANGLINRLMEEGSLFHIGIVVIDELHLLGDPFRGYLLELLITKIRYMSLESDNVNIQIVGMSATLPNLQALASWLNAHLYKTDFRPIPLNEYLKVGTTIYSKNLEVNRILETKYDLQDDPDNVVELCLETIFTGHSILIFCPTKNWCEKLAIGVAKELYKLGNCDSEIGLQLRKQLNSSAIAEALEQLKSCPVGLDSALGKSVSFGAAFHHAGLTIDERDIIEGLFRSGVIRVLVATSTLSSGVNLPARRVLIRTPVFYRRPLDVQVYQQMVGRAGRMGKDSEGESILLCSNLEKKTGEKLIQESLNPVTSCLGHGELSSSLKRAILEVIASGVAETPDQLKCYTDCTLLAASHTGLENPIESCLAFLIDNECIRLQLSEDGSKKYVPTPLGNACLAASMSPDDGLELFRELQKARQNFVLENELHLVYLVTPFSVSAQWTNLDWLQIMNLWEKLPPGMRRVGHLIGVDESFMVRALRGTINLNNHKQLHKLSVHRRFYTALALQELVNEVPLVEVSLKFQCSKGMLQSLQQTSSTFAGMVTAFCRRLGWRNLELLISQFQDRLQFGVQRELCELMRLDVLNGPRARALFNAGITSIGDLASADICQVENALHKSVTFQTAKEMEGETAFDAACRNQLRTIWITGRKGLTEREAAELLIKEAQKWLEVEFGLVDVRWKKDNGTSHGSQSMSSSISSKNIDTDISPNGNSTISCNEVTKSSDADKTHVDLEICEEKACTVNEEKKCNTNNDCHDDTIEESQSFDEGESENEICVTSPMSDIFDASQENSVEDESCCEDLSVPVSNSDSPQVSKPVKAVCALVSAHSYPTTVPIASTSIPATTVILDNPKACTLMNSCEDVIELPKDIEQSQLLNVNSKLFTVHESKNSSPSCGTPDLLQSRYSVDMFASPLPTESCSSPNLFEESLVLNSYLDKMLDMSSSKLITNSKNLSEQKCEVRSENINDLRNERKFSQTIGEDHNKNSINETKSHHNLVENTVHHLHNSNLNILNIDNKSPNKCIPLDKNLEGSHGREIYYEKVVVSERKAQTDLLNVMNQNNEKQVSADAHESVGNVGLSAFDEVLTESFLKQAFTTYCDFNETNSNSRLSKDFCAQISVQNKGKHTSTECESMTKVISNAGKCVDDMIILEKDEVGVPVGKRDNVKVLCKTKSVMPTVVEIANHNELKDVSSKNVVVSVTHSVNSRSQNLVIEGSEINQKMLTDNDNSWISINGEVVTKSFMKQAFTTVCDFDQTYCDTPSNACAAGSRKNKQFGFLLERECVTKNVPHGDESSCCLKPETSVKLPLKDQHLSPVKMQLSSGKQEKNNSLNDATFTTSVIDRIEGVKNKLSFVSDSDEGENDLVPSSQSQSDTSSHVSVHNTRVQKKKHSKQNFRVSKRQKTEGFNFEKPKAIKDDPIKPKEHSDLPWESFKIVDVCSQRNIFEQFKEDILKQSHISFSVACEYNVKKSPRTSIGDKIVGKKTKKEENVSNFLVCEKYRVVGLAVCLGQKIAYYVGLDPSSKGSSSQTLVSFSEQLDLIESIMSHEGEYLLSAYDIKEQYKILYQSCSVNIEKEICDPKVAEWMLDPENCEKNIQSLMSKYIPSSTKLFRRVGNVAGAYSLGLNVRSQIHARVRASVETIATWHLISKQIKSLEERKLYRVFKEIEMPTLLCLAHVEINGIGFNRAEAEKLLSVFHNHLLVLEQEAYKLAGHSFSLSSRNDVSKVLFKELQLKCSKFTSAHKQSTSKDVLIKLKNDHPLPSVILEWRKMHFIMSKVLLPLLKVGISERIFGHYITDSVTGRIHMNEPNLQSIPRNYEIFGKEEGGGEEVKIISMRRAFVPKTGKTFISADYSQLELRLLAHLSQDKALIDILKKDNDVFKSVASSWKQIPEAEVTDILRQRAKQVCYGVIYGIGSSALSDQLEVDEEEATLFMETFLNAYPGLKKFRMEVVKKCREKGFVETLFGRKRYLPLINSCKPHLKAQAERQAINTTVQGSAADIAKTGMVLVEASLKAAFPHELTRIRRLRENKRQCIETCTATLVLHLHDELLYEVIDNCVEDVIQIVKGSMEAAANLTVPLPVKVKYGKSWGSLVDLK